MPMTTHTLTLHGGCHCGGLHVAFSSDQHAATIAPRACDCTFCRKHGAAWISDPAGRLAIRENATGALREYQQGSNAARFLHCAHCGVLVAVIFRHHDRIHGAVNAGCLDGDPGLGNAIPASPQTLAPDEKMARWLALWIPDVTLVTQAE